VAMWQAILIGVGTALLAYALFLGARSIKT
jgi:hypothetical protein